MILVDIPPTIDQLLATLARFEAGKASYHHVRNEVGRLKRVYWGDLPGEGRRLWAALESALELAGEVEGHEAAVASEIRDDLTAFTGWLQTEQAERAAEIRGTSPPPPAQPEQPAPVPPQLGSPYRGGGMTSRLPPSALLPTEGETAAGDDADGDGGEPAVGEVVQDQADGVADLEGGEGPGV